MLKLGDEVTIVASTACADESLFVRMVHSYMG